MGLMDAFTADARVEFKVGELYDVLRAAANNEKTAKFLMNAVKCEVPYKYIREVMTGEKEEVGGVRVEISKDTIDKAIETARKAQEEAARKAAQITAGMERATGSGILTDAGEEKPLSDCADGNITCEECPKKEFCDQIAEDIAGMAEETEEQGDGEE